MLIDGEARRRRPGRLRPALLPPGQQLLLDNGQGPYYYLPKMESHLEARLWNDIFIFAEDELGIPHGTIRATVLIETIPAAFEMDEILYELRDHAAGLNAGRWDYLFSIIKYFRDAGPDFVLPDRADIAMTAPFMRAYTELLVKTCHRRGAFAMGGMAAFIPNRSDPEVNAAGLRQGARRTRPGRPTTASTAPGWPIRTWCRSARRSSMPCWANGPTSWTERRGRCAGHRGPAAGHRLGGGQSPRRACATTSTSRSPTRRSGCPGNGAVAHPQPDGGRRHGGDLPLAGVAAAITTR